MSDQWINKMGTYLTMEYYSTLKGKEDSATCYNMDEPEGHYAKKTNTV